MQSLVVNKMQSLVSMRDCEGRHQGEPLHLQRRVLRPVKQLKR